ncbi:MAG: hypothetical protein U0441_23215 [Polyangiaceae bacterium]
MSDDTPTPDLELEARVERALLPYRSYLTDEEYAERRRMLLFLARTHPNLSTWIEDQRPRAVPDQSGTIVKKDTSALERAAARLKTRGGRGT